MEPSSGRATGPVLDATNLSVTFGGLRALDDVSLTVERGSLVGLIGPNGAGKTTLVDGLTGFVPMEGHITFAGRDLSGASPHARARAGLVRTWQSLELFDDLTVRENLRVAAERASLRQLLLDLIHPERRPAVDAIEKALEQLELTELGDKIPRELSQGQRKLVGVARALAADPELLLMDEPAAGLDTSESRSLAARLRRIADGGTSILLIDHDMHLVLSICDQVYVLEFGKLIAAGTPQQVRSDPRVVAAYLGERAAAVGADELDRGVYLSGENQGEVDSWTT